MSLSAVKDQDAICTQISKKIKDAEDTIKTFQDLKLVYEKMLQIYQDLSLENSNDD